MNEAPTLEEAVATIMEYGTPEEKQSVGIFEGFIETVKASGVNDLEHPPATTQQQLAKILRERG